MNYYNEHDRYAAAWLRELIADGQIPKGEVDERSIVEVQPRDIAGFTQCHFFAGIGGWSYALKLANWPNERPVWTGSCPCQPFSSAGKQQGLADERHLWPTWFRLIRECKPPVVFGEQVEAAVRHGWLDGVFTDMEGEGYACGAAVLGAHSVGAPQIRQRLWWVAESYQRRRDERASTARARPSTVLADFSDRKVSGMADADQFGNNGRSRSGEQSVCDEDKQVSGVDESAPIRRQPVAANRCEHGKGDGPSESRGLIGNRCVSCGLGFSEGEQARIPGLAWRHSESIACADGKSRRIESGTSPLVARLSETVVPSGDPSFSYVQATAEGRQMRLRGYGNAIVPQVAAEFIAAYMEWNRMNGKQGAE